MASPSPVPPWRRRTASSACSNSEKRDGSVSGAMPMPVSSTAMATSKSSISLGGFVMRDLRTVTSTPPPSVNLMALPSRLVTIWRTRTSSANSGLGSAGSTAQATSMPFS